MGRPSLLFSLLGRAIDSTLEKTVSNLIALGLAGFRIAHSGVLKSGPIYPLSTVAFQVRQRATGPTAPVNTFPFQVSLLQKK